MNTVIFPSPAMPELGNIARMDLHGLSAPALYNPERAVFLHTGWRSGGTWIWSVCRSFPRLHGYYEPLHEHAARFRRRDVAAMRPGSWHSNHSETAPYFEEYHDLIAPHRRGVPLYRTRFAFDAFFRAPDDPADPELEAYLAALMAAPIAQGRLPVFKFCRSMGRVGWFEKRFPQAMHAVVLRDPSAQFHSGQRLLRVQRNRYFALAPLLVLARNAGDPMVREAATALGVSLPTLYSDDLDYAVETCWRHVRRSTPAERYRGFLAFWTLSALSALDSDALVIDMDAVRGDPVHRHRVEAALQARTGEPIRLDPRDAAAVDIESRPVGWREAHAAACDLVRARHYRLTPQRRELILTKLDHEPAERTYWGKPSLPAPRAPQSVVRRSLTWSEVQLARATQPLRRLNGSLRKQ